MCQCLNGFEGYNCELVKCDGLYLTETTPQEISVPNQTNLNDGCIWTFESPPDMLANLRIERISYYYCSDFKVALWEGM